VTRATHTREDLNLGTDEDPSPPTGAFVRTGEWQQRIVASALAGTLALSPVTAAGLDCYVQLEERPTHASLLGGQQAVTRLISPPHKIGLAEAIRLADANYQRVEGLLDREVERDALGTAVWEEE